MGAKADTSTVAGKEAEAERLNRQARLYPWAQFGVQELAMMLRVAKHVVTAVAARPDGPFKGKLKVCRPELVAAFLANPPEGFEVNYGNKTEE